MLFAFPHECAWKSWSSFFFRNGSWSVHTYHRQRKLSIFIELLKKPKKSSDMRIFMLETFWISIKNFSLRNLWNFLPCIPSTSSEKIFSMQNCHFKVLFRLTWKRNARRVSRDEILLWNFNAIMVNFNIHIPWASGVEPKRRVEVD